MNFKFKNVFVYSEEVFLILQFCNSNQTHTNFFKFVKLLKILKLLKLVFTKLLMLFVAICIVE